MLYSSELIKPREASFANSFGGVLIDSFTANRLRLLGVVKFVGLMR